MSEFESISVLLCKNIISIQKQEIRSFNILGSCKEDGWLVTTA